MIILIIGLSYLIPIHYRKNPTNQNKTICYILGITDAIYVIQGATMLLLGRKIFSSRPVFKLEGVFWIVLFGWLIYRIYKVLKYTEIIEKENNYCAKCNNQKTDKTGKYWGICSQNLREHILKHINIRKKDSGGKEEKTIKLGYIEIPISLDFEKLKDRDKIWEYGITLAGSILVILIIFQNWLHILELDKFNNLFFRGNKGLGSKYSLFTLGDIVKIIYSYEQELNMKFILNYMDLGSILLEAGAILIILIQLFYLYAFFTNNKLTGEIGIASTLVTTTISIAFIVLVSKMNSGITDRSYGLISTALSTTAMPYLAIICSLPLAIYGFISQKERMDGK